MVTFNIRETGNELLRILEKELPSTRESRLTVDLLIPDMLKGDKDGLCLSILLICQCLTSKFTNSSVDIELSKVSHIGESLTVKVNIKGNSYKREMTQQFWRTHRADVDALRTRLPYPTTFSANGAYVRFSFILQLFDTGKSKTSRAEIAGKKILLVEDDDMTALVFTSFMEEWDCVVTRVADGASAVEVATTQAHDLILMDIFLPKMSGAEAIRKIRESDNMTPIIALTSSSIDKDFTERYIGANDVLVKPVSEVDLQRMLTRYA